MDLWGWRECTRASLLHEQMGLGQGIFRVHQQQRSAAYIAAKWENSSATCIFPVLRNNPGATD